MQLSIKITQYWMARLALFVMLAFAFFIQRFSPEQIELFLTKVPYRCPLRLFTGWKCAFCGITHSWISIFRGEFAQAFQENVLGPFLFIGVVGGLILLSFRKSIQVSSRILLAAIAILIAYAIFRNVI